MDKNPISITLEAGEWNVVLNALAARPYAEVFAVVGKLQQQANEQLPATDPAAQEVK